MLKSFLAVSALALTGCGVTPRAQMVSVPIPVICQAEIPEVPAWPTETQKARLTALPPTEFLDQFVAVTTAEIELRKGYEGRLLAALESCTTKKD